MKASHNLCLNQIELVSYSNSLLLPREELEKWVKNKKLIIMKDKKLYHQAAQRIKYAEIHSFYLALIDSWIEIYHMIFIRDVWQRNREILNRERSKGKNKDSQIISLSEFLCYFTN